MKTLILHLFLVLLSMSMYGQSGVHDFRLVLDTIDCTNMNVKLDLELKANSPVSIFNIGNLNARISYNRTVIEPNSAILVEELELSGFVEDPTNILSVYGNHTLNGSIDTVISYSLPLGGGPGAIATSETWWKLGRIQVDFIQGSGCTDFIIHDNNIFPSSEVSEKVGNFQYPTGYGEYYVLTICPSAFCSENLPVELISFSSENNDCQVGLNWVTASESENDYFLVQHSEEGSVFETIGLVNGAGNSTSENYYSFQDETRRRDGYYRLVQVDFDGTRSISEKIYVRTPCFYDPVIGTQSIYPNPVRDGRYIKLDFTSDKTFEDATYQIVDITGKIVKSETFIINEGTNRLKMEVDDFAAGVYFVKIQTNDWISSPSKFIKLH